MLKHALAAQSVEVKSPRKGRGVRAHSLREQDYGVAVGDVETI